MTSLGPNPRSRTLILLVVAVFGIALGAGGLVLLRPFGPGGPERLAAADRQPAARPLSDAAVRARIEPSVVDVTAALTYDDETASGTGFVVMAPAGGTDLIVTNNHVVRGATSVAVTVPATGRAYPASIVGVDVPADIAILSVSPGAGLPSAPLGNSATVTDGAAVISFGNRAGAGGSPTVAPGVITGTGRTVQADDGAAGFSETLHDMLATTAQIEPGDSGGPLASTAGTVIGVDTAAGTGGPGNGTGTGYAIPINAAMAAERQIAARRPGQGVSLGVGGFLGVIVASGATRSPGAQQEQEEEQGIAAGSAVSPAPAACVPTEDGAAVPAAIAPVPAGALVAGVLCGTGAAAAGIAPGDVITAAEGRPVDSPEALTAIVSGSPPGRVIQVTWVATSGITRSARVRLGPAPAL